MRERRHADRRRAVRRAEAERLCVRAAARQGQLREGGAGGAQRHRAAVRDQDPEEGPARAERRRRVRHDRAARARAAREAALPRATLLRFPDYGTHIHTHTQALCLVSMPNYSYVRNKGFRIQTAVGIRTLP